MKVRATVVTAAFLNLLLNVVAVPPVPEGVVYGEHEHALMKAIDEGLKAVAANYDQFRFRDAATESMNIARAANKYFNDKAPWKSVKSDAADCALAMNVCLQVVHTLGVVFAPLAPDDRGDLFTWHEGGVLRRNGKVVSDRVAPELRWGVWLCVPIATLFEVLGSSIWGGYTYELHNIPLYVPPGHALVYVFGVTAAGLPVMRRHGWVVRRLVMLVATAWVVAGLTVLPWLTGRLDLQGASQAIANVLEIVLEMHALPVMLAIEHGVKLRHHLDPLLRPAQRGANLGIFRFFRRGRETVADHLEHVAAFVLQLAQHPIALVGARLGAAVLLRSHHGIPNWRSTLEPMHGPRLIHC